MLASKFLMDGIVSGLFLNFLPLELHGMWIFQEGLALCNVHKLKSMSV